MLRNQTISKTMKFLFFPTKKLSQRLKRVYIIFFLQFLRYGLWTELAVLFWKKSYTKGTSNRRTMRLINKNWMGLKANLVKNLFYIKTLKPVFSTLIFVVLALDNLQNIIISNISYDILVKQQQSIVPTDRQWIWLDRLIQRFG